MSREKIRAAAWLGRGRASSMRGFAYREDAQVTSEKPTGSASAARRVSTARPHLLEERRLARGDELHVAQDHERVELEGDLLRVGAGVEIAGGLRGRDLLGEQREPVVAERHRLVADGARARVELAHRRDEEAPAGEDALLDVVEEAGDMRPAAGGRRPSPPRPARSRAPRRSCAPCRSSPTAAPPRAEEPEQPTLADPDRLGQARDRQAVEPFDGRSAAPPRAGSRRGCGHRRSAGHATVGERGLGGGFRRPSA